MCICRDSGIRLSPGGQVLYFGQIAEETLVQQLKLFSFWRARTLPAPMVAPLQHAVQSLDTMLVDDGLLLIREQPAAAGS